MTTPMQSLTDALSDRYRIERELGAGGMATVYLAHDLKHERDVAIKVLHPDLGAALGADRFLAEIRTTARLQHPHILPLLDSGNADGLLYYVMPLVTGETLRARLEREKQLPIEKAVSIAREVADALGHAHELGVIHRDIKPENILLQGGHALVADFGIALAVQSAGGSRMTQTGLSLGTPQYMSPEQAMGEKIIDARSDIYALGAVTYEMLTGDPPFTGSTVQAIVAKVLTERPTAPRAVRDTVSPAIEYAVLKALAKLPADRFATAQEFAAALSGSRSFDTADQFHNAAAHSTRKTADWRSRLLIGALTTVAVAGVATSTWLATRHPATVNAELMRFDVRLPDSVNVWRGGGHKLALSHDGSMLVIAGIKGSTAALYLRRLGDPVAQLIRGTEFRPTPRGPNPVFSEDGSHILFSIEESEVVVPTNGGNTRRVADSAAAGSIRQSDVMLFVRNSSIWVGSMTSTDTRLLIGPDKARGLTGVKWPHLLPGETHALVTIDKASLSGDLDSLYLGVVSLKDGSIAELGVRGTDARYVSSGHILFGRNGGEVYTAPFSLSKLAVTGPVARVLENVWQGSGGATDFVVSDDGTMAYTNAVTGDMKRELLVVDTSGRTRRIPGASSNAMYPRISRDGKRVVAGAGWNEDGGVWLTDVTSGSVSPFAAIGAGFVPEWMPDDQHVLYLRTRQGVRELVSRAWDGSGSEQVLARDTLLDFYGITAGPAHGFAVYRARKNDDLYYAPMDSLSAIKPLMQTPRVSEMSPAISPDGRFVAYTSNEGATTNEVYVQALPGPGRRVRLSVNGGSEPLWAGRGNTLYFRGPSRIMQVTLSPTLDIVKRDSLFFDTMDRAPNSSRRNWDMMPNGHEFLMVQWRATDEVSVVVNWPQLLGRKN
ncbi:MAG: protein kinase [Gemmatimonas sp.]